MPERFRATHPDQREPVAPTQESARWGAGLGLRGRRKDGDGFQIDFMVSAMETIGSPIFLWHGTY